MYWLCPWYGLCLQIWSWRFYVQTQIEHIQLSLQPQPSHPSPSQTSQMSTIHGTHFPPPLPLHLISLNPHPHTSDYHIIKSHLKSELTRYATRLSGVPNYILHQQLLMSLLVPPFPLLTCKNTINAPLSEGESSQNFPYLREWNTFLS